MTRHTRLRTALFTALVLTSSALGCAKREAASAPAATLAAPPPPAAAPAIAAGMAGEKGVFAFSSSGRLAADTEARSARQAPNAPRATDGRKIVRNGNLEVRVDDYEPVRAKIDALLKASGGFIANAQVGHSDGRVTEATLVLRVPSEGYQDLLAQLAALGTVIAESSSADDVTDQWVDVSARLANAKKLEGRLIELVSTQAGNVTQLLEVERELASVREQIELFEGRLHVLDDQVSLSTLTLRVSTRAPFVAAVQPSFGGDAGRALTASWASLRDLGRGLSLGFIGLLPWLPLIGAGALGVRYARRRVRRALPAPAPATKST